jgi:hypothetical protein
MQRAAIGDNWRHRITHKEQAILHHRDSTGAKALTEAQIKELPLPSKDFKIASRLSSRDGAMHTASASSWSGMQVTSDNASIKLLKRIGLLANCSDEFLGLIANSSEYLQLKEGEVRDMDGSRIGFARIRPAVGIIVESGNFRIERNHTVVEECSAGSCFGLANVLASSSVVSSGRSGTGGGTPCLVDFVVRAWGACPEGHRILMFHSNGVRHAIQECPFDNAKLQHALHILSQSVDTIHHVVTTLHCAESAKAAITEATTRHIFLEGDCICRAHQKNPDGLVLIRSGTVALEINDVEVRRISRGQAIGEEMLFGVSRKWSITARCATLCDVVVLHRRLFISAVKEMQYGSREESRESERLMLFLSGHWKDDKLILSWPLFRGFDADLIATLAHLIETRVMLPGTKLWESGGTSSCSQSTAEVALYVLLSGTCEEAMTTEQKRAGHAGTTETRFVKRELFPGSCMGIREFLGLLSLAHLVVKVRSLSIVALLHRAVFLKALEDHPVETPQATEITDILKDELDKGDSHCVHPVTRRSSFTPRGKLNNKDSFMVYINELPVFKEHGKRFIEHLCAQACKNVFCMPGQTVCCKGRLAKTMYVFIRGEAHLNIAQLHVKDYAVGDAINTLALAKEDFIPKYTVQCVKASEFLAISQENFNTSLEQFPDERVSFSDLVHAPTDLEIIVKKMKTQRRMSQISHEDDDDWHHERSPSGHGASTPTISNFGLTDINMFRSCSQDFLAWISEHLEATIYFKDNIIVPIDAKDSSLYIIRYGSVVSEGTDSNQDRLDAGSVLGEHRLLGINEKSQTTDQALEVAVFRYCTDVFFKKHWSFFQTKSRTSTR